ncbi:MAG: prepilin-type N-terminal cleavage/methylation domain-containing protein [Planctomycetes bacterium]|nr:prepilin-type N-terminal cleavage/methylation domain-containing protein [Planctomycetota bacterium]
MNGMQRSSPASFPRAGFTLIELLAVILIVSILVATLTPVVADAIRSAEVNGCAGNMRQINNGLLIYRTKYGGLPPHSGVRFFADLIARGAIENTKANAEKLTCTGIDKASLAIGTLPWEEWWKDLDLVNGSYSAYAGRDMKNHPIRQLTASGNEPLISDDNDPGMNHHTTTNVLYADGTVQTFELEDLKSKGTLTADETVLKVGPDSPVPDLTKLTLD